MTEYEIEEYIKLAYNQWKETVQTPSDIELGGKLFKNFLISSLIFCSEKVFEYLHSGSSTYG